MSNNMHWYVLYLVFINVKTANMIFELVIYLFLSLKTRAVILFMQNVNRNFWHVVYIYVST